MLELRDRIINFLLQQDMPHTATELANQFGASRDTVKRNLAALVDDGVVERLHKTGPRNVDCFRLAERA